MLTDDMNISLLETYWQDTRKFLAEAKKLKSVWIPNSSSCLTQNILKLQEKEIKLSMQQNEANTIFASIFNALEDIIGFVQHLQKKNGKVGANYKPLDLSERKITRLMDHLNTLKVQVEDQKNSFESPLGVETVRLLGILKSKAYENRSIDSDIYLGKFEERIKKMHQLDELRFKKIQGESRMKRLTEDISHGRDFLKLLEEEIQEVEKKLAERIKFEENSGNSQNSYGLETVIKKLDEKKKSDYDQDLQPKEQKIQELKALLEGTISSKSIEQRELRRKFHFLFVVNQHETMNAEKSKEVENCINAVIEDRKKEKDLYSLILFDQVVSIRACQQEMKDFVKLPKEFVKNDKNSLNNVFAHVSNLIQASPYQDYAPIVILLTDGMQKTGFFLKETKPIDDHIVKQASESVSQMHSSFGRFGFHLFIFGISPYYHQGLRQIATSGNGGKTLLEGPNENHDFLNNCKFKRILPDIFRDLTNSSANKLLNNPQATIKEIIDNIKDSISLSKKFIDERYDKLKRELQKKPQRNYKHEPNSIRKSYEERLRALQEERDEWKTKSHVFEEDQNSLKITLPLDYDIIVLEDTIEQELIKEKEDYQKKAKEEFIVMNPDKVNISQSIEALEKLRDMFGRKSSSLALVLHSLLIKTGQLLNGLKKQESLIFRSLLEHYMSSLGPDASCTDEAVIMVKVAKTCLDMKSDEKILHCLFKLIPSRMLCDLDEDVPFLEQKIREEALILFLTAESKMKVNEKDMDDLLLKLDVECDNVKKTALREEKEALRKQKLGIQAELEVMNKDGVEIFQNKLIVCFRDLRRKLSETKEALPASEKPMLDKSTIMQCMDIQKLIEKFSKIEYNI